MPTAQSNAIEDQAPNDDVATATVTVAVLGELEVRGLAQPLTSAPVQELLCFLALHPGRSYTTAELRNAIWAEPRLEPTAKTFRNYVWMLRKALPVRRLRPRRLPLPIERRRGLGLGRLRRPSRRGRRSRLSHLRSALELVRGRPFANAGARDPDTYGWARVEFSVVMERAIEDTTHELVTLALGTQ